MVKENVGVSIKKTAHERLLEEQQARIAASIPKTIKVNNIEDKDERRDTKPKRKPKSKSK